MATLVHMSSWVTEGTAHRTGVQRTPVIHLLVDNGGDWAMWCSGSKGREDSPYGGRLCRPCRELARECYERGEWDDDDVHMARWLHVGRVPRRA